MSYVILNHLQENMYQVHLLLVILVLQLQCSLLESFFIDRADPTRYTSQYKVAYRITSSHLCMGKGDGKKKRKKKSSATAASAPQEAPAYTPMRVSTDINIPVKRQIKWAKMNQEYVKAQTSFRQNNVRKKTSYRKRLDEEEQQQVIDAKRHRNSEVNWDVILANGNGTSVGALMLVDGYNVIYQWPRLKKQMKNCNTQRAREMLVRDLEDLHNIKGWRIECVFDGFGRKTTGPLGDGPGTDRISMADREFNRKDTGRGVRIVYSGVGASADTYIEKRCLDAKSITQGKLSVSSGSLIVASNDAMIRLAATSAGALVMSSDRLVDELRAVKKATEYRVEAAMAIANGSVVRPDGLRKKGINMPRMQGARGTGANSVGVTEVNGKQVVNTFRGGQFIIEDKRKKKAKPKKNIEDKVTKKKAEFGDMVEGTQQLPSWAVMPNATKVNDNR